MKSLTYSPALRYPNLPEYVRQLFPHVKDIPSRHALEQQSNQQIVKERIEDGANEKAALRFPITALSFASISIFPG